ncbi:MAG: acyltransferase [Clostridia bacterium]|nr:acyltransferase [Clostridia bacterium]
MKRNGKIEILRFVLCIVVILYHINNDLWNGNMTFNGVISFFDHGRTCVEFFFLLSGFLMAKSAYSKPLAKDMSIGKDTVSFVYKKIQGVWIPYVILSAAMIIYIPFGFKNPLERIISRLPSLLFLQRTGIEDGGFISVSWYLSSLFFAIAVIYPFLRKFYDYISLVAAPLVASIAIGALIHIRGSFPQESYGGFIHLSNIRAIAVVLLGVFAFRVSLYLKEANLSKSKWRLLIITENLCWLISLYYLISVHSNRYEGHITYLMAAAIAISFARDYKSKLYNSSLAAYLGRISLPIYLAQSIVRTVINQNLDHLNNWVQAALIVAVTIVLGTILDWITTYIKKKKAVN